MFELHFLKIPALQRGLFTSTTALQQHSDITITCYTTALACQSFISNYY